MSRKQSINVLSHELIHLKQYYNKELMIIKDSIYWKNELINIFSISYKNRPWEIEAYADQKNIERDMLKILY